MVLEAVLLIGALLAALFLDITDPPLLALYALVVVLCLPVIRLIILRGPPFVPTPKKTVGEMLRLAAIKPGERVYDLGCGDGRLLIAAHAKGAVCTGYELSVPTLLLAKFRTRGTGIRVRYGDFWKQDYRDADVIFCYLLIGAMKTFEETVWPQLKPGARVVSHSFQMPGVQPSGHDGDAVLYVK